MSMSEQNLDRMEREIPRLEPEAAIPIAVARYFEKCVDTEASDG